MVVLGRRGITISSTAINKKLAKRMKKKKKDLSKSISSDPVFKACLLSLNIKPVTFLATGERFPNVYLAHLLFQKPCSSPHFFAASFDLSQDSKLKFTLLLRKQKISLMFHIKTQKLFGYHFLLDSVINKLTR